MPPLRSPLGRSPHHCSVDFFEKRPSPHPFYKKGAGIPAPLKGAGIGNARTKVGNFETMSDASKV